MILVMNTTGGGEAPLAPGSGEDEGDSGGDGDPGDDGDSDGDGDYGDSGDSGDAEDSGDSGGSGDDDDSSDGEDSQLEAEREAVTAATEEILQEIEATRTVCRQFDSDMAAASLAADYQRSEDAFTGAQGVATTMHASTQSFLHSGDQTYSGVRHLLNERQQTLRERFARESAREVGDPVRISDGHFTFEVPLPVIDHWEISVDLTLRYDGARSERSAFGPGWWWEPAQRVVPGVRPLPPMQPVLDDFRTDLAEARSVLSTAYSDTFGSAPVVSHASDQLAILLAHWSAAAETYSELHESLTELLERAAEDPVMKPVVSAALRHIEQLTALHEQERARFAGSLEFLHAWEAGRSVVEHAQSTLTEEEERFTRHRARYEGERSAQATYLPPGAAAGNFEIGSGAVAYFGDRGALHSFFSQNQEGALTTYALPWHTLSGTEPSGYAIQEPSGTRRLFSNTGQLVRIEDGAGHALIFERDSQGRLTAIRDEHGETRATFAWHGSACEIDIPTLDPTTVDLDQGVIRRVAGPRGSLTLEYEGGLLSRILRADGSWTAIAREPGGLRRVVAVEHSTGAVERVRYESDERRVYVGPDG
ncbi:MAG: RHS repeat domain-containing protein, partial [Alkalispirochaeta sp.]